MAAAHRTADLPGAAPLTRDAAGARPAPRVLAVDVLRGLVLLFLLPDLSGGFSFYRVAERLPGDGFWHLLAMQFRHVDWQGVAAWDLVMPLFVFLVGVAMALSYEARVRAGQPAAQIAAHAFTRSAALFVLGLALQMSVQSRVDELLPYLVLSLGLPVGRWAMRAWPGRVADERRAEHRAEMAYAVLVLGFAAAWMLMHLDRLDDYAIGTQILALLGLAYMPAFWVLRRGLRAQAVAAAAVTAMYGLVFTLYAPGDAAWVNGRNAAAAFDLWFMNLLPRSVPYTGSEHGYHSLLFVPLVGVVLAGTLVGRLLAREGASAALARRFAAIALGGLALSAAMSLSVAPLLKSLWTPTWSVFSTSACLLMLAGLMHLPAAAAHWRPIRALVVLGTNSMLLYVIAFTERWRITHALDAVAGAAAAAAPLWPLVQSLAVLAVLWSLAWALHRARIFVRI